VALLLGVQWLKTAVALAYHMGIDACACDFALSYLRNVDAIPALAQFDLREHIVERPSGGLINSVTVCYPELADLSHLHPALEIPIARSSDPTCRQTSSRSMCRLVMRIEIRADRPASQRKMQAPQQQKKSNGRHRDRNSMRGGFRACLMH
jgi:hypothetical protein